VSGLLVRDDGAVRVLAFSRPPGNALGRELLGALLTEIARAAADPKVRALVLASELPKYFSSGLDIAEIMSLPEERRSEVFEAMLLAYKALLACPKPVVGGLSGTAILGGWILAMACDWRVMAQESGKVALSEVRMGLTPTPALVRRLASLSTDPRVVKEMVLRGKTVRAEEAFACGLVDELAPEAETQARAVALAKRLGKSAPVAYATIKKGMNAPFLDDSLWDASMDEFKTLLGGAEAQEGLEAMRAKKRPRWED
jgi:enoyl-CoA hydratase/carnithine racemase